MLMASSLCHYLALLVHVLADFPETSNVKGTLVPRGNAKLINMMHHTDNSVCLWHCAACDGRAAAGAVSRK